MSYVENYPLRFVKIEKFLKKREVFQLPPRGVGKQISGYMLGSHSCIELYCYFRKNLTRLYRTLFHIAFHGRVTFSIISQKKNKRIFLLSSNNFLILNKKHKYLSIIRDISGLDFGVWSMWRTLNLILWTKARSCQYLDKARIFFSVVCFCIYCCASDLRIRRCGRLNSRNDRNFHLRL